MRAAIILAALAAAALVLRRLHMAPRDEPLVKETGDIVGMPTTWPERSVITNTFTLGPVDWDAWFDTAGRKN